MKIAVITEDVGHLTGGRYYTYFIASALVELGHDVTVYTNRKPIFGEYFQDYKKPEIKIIRQHNRDLETINVKADVYIGSPIHGNIAAIRLGQKYRKPAYAIIFDPLPMIEKFKGVKVLNKDWARLCSLLKGSNASIISLCNAINEYIYEWLDKKDIRVESVYPCINSKEKNKAKFPVAGGYALFISRIVSHKNFDHAVWAAKKANLRLKVITSIDGMNSKLIVKKFGMKHNTDFHFNLSDKDKFEMIRGATVLLHPTTFEGFGIPVAEAISCGIPIVAYEYPTTREIESYSKTDLIYWADINQPKDFLNKLLLALKHKKKREEVNMFDFEAMVERLREVIE